MMKEKIILRVLMLVNLYAFVWNILLFYGVVPLKNYNSNDYLFSLFIFFSVAILIKHRFWIFAFIFMGLNRLSYFIIAKMFANFNGNLFTSFRDVDNVFAFLSLIAGTLCVLVSTIYFYKLLRTKEFSFRQYFRFATRKNY
jgi:hypothetical protein